MVAEPSLQSRTHHSQECNGLSSTATNTIPRIKSSYDDWDDFVDQVKRHSHSVNPGSAPSLKISTVSAIDHANADRGRVFCPHRDSGCQYGFTVEFAICGGLHCGRVKVIKVCSRHSVASELTQLVISPKIDIAMLARNIAECCSVAMFVTVSGTESSPSRLTNCAPIGGSATPQRNRLCSSISAAQLGCISRCF